MSREDKVVCGRCQGVFTWDEAYRGRGTPGRYGAPIGWADWGDSVYCPHCGGLVAHGTVEGGEEGAMSWVGPNAEVNSGPPSTPSSLTMWGLRIPIQLKPLYEDDEIDLDAVLAFRERCIDDGLGDCRGEVEARDPVQPCRRGAYRCARHWELRLEEEVPDARPAWLETYNRGMELFNAQDYPAAAEQFDASAELGLLPEVHAEMLCSTGFDMLMDGGDVDVAANLCRRGIGVDPFAMWQAYALIAMVELAHGNHQVALGRYEDARRFARTQWFVPEYEQQMLQHVEAGIGNQLAWPPSV